MLFPASDGDRLAAGREAHRVRMGATWRLRLLQQMQIRAVEVVEPDVAIVAARDQPPIAAEVRAEAAVAIVRILRNQRPSLTPVETKAAVAGEGRRQVASI